jgi:hypothetical protein
MLFYDVKLALRISNAAYDEEIDNLILEAKEDLEWVGILPAKIIDTDVLIKRAILTYCKANFGLNNPDSVKLQLSYEAIRNHLAMSIDYIYFTVTIIATEQGTITFDGETKESNDAGVAIFYSKAQDHVEYILDGVTDYIDITQNTIIGV